MSKKSKYYISFLIETIVIIILFLALFKFLFIRDFVHGIYSGALIVIISFVGCDLLLNIFDFIELIKNKEDSDGSEEIQSDIHDDGN